GRVRPVRVRVLAPTVLDDALHRGLDVLRQHRVGVLVDRHSGGRVWHVDQRRRGSVGRLQRLLDQLRDLDELSPPFRAKADLTHAGILRNPCRRLLLLSASSTPIGSRRIASLRSSTRSTTSTTPASRRPSSWRRSTSGTPS